MSFWIREGEDSEAGQSSVFSIQLRGLRIRRYRGEARGKTAGKATNLFMNELGPQSPKYLGQKSRRLKGNSLL